MARVFLSYSSHDKASAGQMKTWLEKQGFEAPFIHFDPETGVQLGADWERELYRAVDQSQALLVLYSPHWNDSKYCYAEYSYARWLGKPILPVIVSGSGDFRAIPIACIHQVLDLRQDRETGMQQLARRLSEIALTAQGGFAWDGTRPPIRA